MLEEELGKIFDAHSDLKASEDPVIVFVTRGVLHKDSFDGYLAQQGISPQDVSTEPMIYAASERILQKLVAGEEPTHEDLVTNRLEQIIMSFMTNDPTEIFYQTILKTFYLNAVTSHFDENEIQELHNLHWRDKLSRRRFNRILVKKGLNNIPRNFQELYRQVQQFESQLPETETGVVLAPPLDEFPTQEASLKIGSLRIDREDL